MPWNRLSWKVLYGNRYPLVVKSWLTPIGMALTVGMFGGPSTIRELPRAKAASP